MTAQTRSVDAVPPMADLSELVHVDEERVDALLMFLLSSMLWQVPDREEGAAQVGADRRALGRQTRAQGWRPVHATIWSMSGASSATGTTALKTGNCSRPSAGRPCL